jgi:2-keto-4-pentenoate hydratase
VLVEEAATARAGDRLLAAAETGAPIAPLTADGPLTLEEAYAVQLHQVDAWLAAGRRIAGFKVGLTSRAIQQQLGVDRPDFGHLFSDMILDGSAPIDVGRFISPRIEPEISFVLRSELAGPGLTLVDVIGAIDYAIASMEIIDSRIADWRITLADTIADNASSGAVVLGTTPLRIDVADLGLIGCVLRRNGEVVATGAGAAVLGHPLNAVLFLANTLGALGRTLPAGSVVMAGALTAAVPVEPGDRFTATFARLGAVEAAFTERAGVSA